MKPEGTAVEKLESCLRSINGMADRPDIIFQGGDVILDALNERHGRVQAQYDLASGVFERYNSLPVEHCIGNHDVWGWGDPAAHAQGHALYGKEWWLQWSGLKRTYRSFDLAGWHFVFLDSITRGKGSGYTAQLGPEQMAWFEKDLANVHSSIPVCVVSHVPILSACSALFGQYEASGHWEIPGALMHVDGRKIKDLLWKHPNVRLCLSGHTHLMNKVEYNGVLHYCGGAVSGAWWNGPMQETQPGYSLIDLHTDGTVHTEYQTY